MDTGVAEETECDVTVNVAVVAFAATVMLAGTLPAALLLLERVTSAPPAGARPLSVIVPVVFAAPPTTAVGESVRD
jgi:hypothetical protein